MKLSKDTLEVLKNFHSINQNLLFEEGNTIRTISAHGNIFVTAEVEETFPETVGVYDLSRLLGVITLFNEPEIDFGKNQMTIKSGSNKVSYAYAGADLLVTPPAKSPKFTPLDFKFKLTGEMFARITKASQVLGVPDLSIVADGEKIVVKVHDSKNSSSDDFSVVVGDTADTYTYNLKIDHLKLLPDNYTVEVSDKQITRFTGETRKTVYYIAPQSE